ncbi:MAG: class I SAM-dependent rRNA methyltransferase [Clostridia bacterium]|nr:class I SAM-dependent rRNA methyltransferase [Clostridia bacterium]
MAKAFLRHTRETRVRSGHSWIFAGDVERTESAQPGDVVDVYSSKNTFLGRAMYNPNSQIALRMLTRDETPIDDVFFYNRVKTAWEYRQLFCDSGCCRAVYSESDFLPGLIVDKFADILSVQVMSLGIDRHMGVIYEALRDIVKPRGIYERSDVPVRRLEGLEMKKDLVWGEVPDRVECVENGIRLLVDVKNGQKTGYFLDQKENRAAIAPFVKGARVLDCFCHIGSFALHAGKYGAAEALGVDISEDAVAAAEENAARNAFGNVSFTAANCFDLLREKYESREKWDVVILDPPAFAKSRSALESARRGYKEINLRGMKLVREGGFLVTCSCSQHMLPDMFVSVINEAARDSGKKIRLVEKRGQAHDHPTLPAAPETEYLKCLILQVF